MESRSSGGRAEPSGGPSTALRRLGPILVLALLAAYPLFWNLGGGLLWSDEADTAVFARNILHFGLPRAWDGRNFTDSDFGARLDSNLVMVGTPWLPFYVTAGSFALLGESTWAARLPFAVAGLATLLLLYVLVVRATGDNRAALAAGLLLLTSTQFLLYARECRHYALNSLLSVGLLLAFLRLRRHPHSPWLFLTAVLLYHTQPLPAVAGLAACGGLTLVHPGFRALARAFWRQVPWILLATFSWSLWTWSGLQRNWSPAEGLGEIPLRLAQFASESLVAIPALGWAIGLPLLWRRFSSEDREWVWLAAALIAAYAALTPLALSPDRLVAYGLRYTTGLLPVAAGLTGLLVARASGRSRALFAVLLVLFGLTHIAGAAPLWLAWDRPARGGTLVIAAPQGIEGKLLNTQWLAFLGDLTRRNPGTVSGIVDFLRAHAAPDDILITNYAWDPLTFYTDLRQGMKLLPDSRHYADARAAGLPDYVFGVEGASWLVWRPFHAATEGLGPLYALPRIEADLRARGARIERVAALEETIWENRPELHHHRFARLGYPFWPSTDGGSPSFPAAVIYRIRWPGAPGRPTESDRTLLDGDRLSPDEILDALARAHPMRLAAADHHLGR
jgi:hypothetical protein